MTALELLDDIQEIALNSPELDPGNINLTDALICDQALVDIGNLIKKYKEENYGSHGA